LAAVHVNDLLVEQVALQQQQTFRRVERRPVVPPSGAADAVQVNPLQGGCRQDVVAAARADDEQGNSCRVLLRGDGSLAHTSANHAGDVENRRAEQLGERKIGHEGRILARGGAKEAACQVRNRWRGTCSRFAELSRPKRCLKRGAMGEKITVSAGWPWV